MVFASLFSFTTAEANNELTKTVNQQLWGTNFSMAIRDLQTGSLSYEYYGNNGISPASTLKPLTASTALSVLGEDYFFSTQMLMDGTIHNGTLNGNIYLRGEGDPTLQVKDFITFSNTLKKKGFSELMGIFTEMKLGLLESDYHQELARWMNPIIMRRQFQH